ncbi:Polyketide cyclase / dehydrase and lipid transport [Planctomycetes bacterium Poly30]|uniref:Polyketide cyclase / dehydrase and lipid transport n=1 Tax=Saltatorellus ferox TaxID=2528018 RepID=A0A518EU29_9BACT|nr:Polyketide cyclase / dehydrase and lipid transport [Planctomycetes bacterium Poly30]
MKLAIEETIAAPIQLVFELFTDLPHAAEHVESIQSLEVIGKGPIGKGTRFRETRVMFGKEATEEMEITAFDPPRSYRVEGISCGVQYTTVYRFEGGQRETKVSMETTSRPLTLVARVTGPILGLMMKGAMRKAMAQDHAELKRVAEDRVAAMAEASDDDGMAQRG